MRASARAVAPTRKDAVRATRSARTIVPLRTRRKARRKRLWLTFVAALFAIAAGIVVLLWQPFLRVQHISAQGPGSDVLAEYIQQALVGTHYGILPRDSIFFIPIAQLRTGILHTYPNIEAVSLSSSGLASLSVSTVGRTTAFWWCGVTHTADKTECYETDPRGKLFKMVVTQQSIASSSEFIVYGAFTQDGTATTSPLGGTLAGANYIPELLRFVKTLKSLGANITSVELRGDEADLYTAHDTRITYVMGRERQAVALAATAFPSLTLTDNSLLYVDLRFDSKIFFKKREADVGKK